MTAIIDLEGQRFGRWFVLRRGKLVGSIRLWVCRCDCGEEREVRGGNLRHGKSTGCGCDRAFSTVHGQASRLTGRTRSYNAWRAMRRRCTKPTERDRERYAGVECDARWSDFRNFYADMGECPEGMTLDRIRGERGYQPGNCRWATRADQNRNTRRNRWVTLNGVSMVLKDAAQLIGISDTAIYQAMKRRGVSAQEAIIIAQAKRR